jgi:hypothetical protein
MDDSEQKERLKKSRDARILSLSGEFTEDRKRVHVNLKLSDASDRPNVNLALIDPSGNEISKTVILEMMMPVLNFTLHLGKYSGELPIRVSAQVCKDEGALIDEKVELVK